VQQTHQHKRLANANSTKTFSLFVSRLRKAKLLTTEPGGTSKIY